MTGVTYHAAWAPAPAPGSRLGQAEASFRVAVVDTDGRPVRGARVSVRGPQGLSGDGKTDGYGLFSTPLPGPLPGTATVEIAVEKDGYGVVRTAAVDEGIRGTAFVRLPVCLPQPVMTSVELGSLAAGLALTAAGLYWKLKPAELIGEVLVGASAFTAIYRHSCL